MRDATRKSDVGKPSDHDIFDFRRSRIRSKGSVRVVCIASTVSVFRPNLQRGREMKSYSNKSNLVQFVAKTIEG